MCYNGGRKKLGMKFFQLLVVGLLENVSIKDTRNGEAQIEPLPLVNTNDEKKKCWEEIKSKIDMDPTLDHESGK